MSDRTASTQRERDELGNEARQRLAVIERALQPYEPQFAQLLSGIPNVEPERIMRSVVINCMRTPRLRDCTIQSLIEAASTGAVLGLEADGVTGQGFLLPFDDKNRGLIAQWITGYKGYNTLGARAGLTIDGAVVREGDAFDYEEGTSAYVRHRKALGKGLDRRIIAAYALATAPGRTPIVKILDIDEIMAVKAKSRGAQGQGGGFSPWNDAMIGFPAMAEKTAKRRLARSMPLSSYVMAARIDEAFEEENRPGFISLERDLVIDGKAGRLADAEPGDPKGPGLAALQRRRYTVRGLREERQFDTIEQWRAQMLELIGQLPPDLLAEWWTRNADIIDALNEEHRDAVQAVGQAYERRTRQ